MPDYGKSEYWNERYKVKDTTFDWFVTYEPIRSLIQSIVQHDHKILVVGAGNSCLSPQMYENGYHHITNIDISDVVIHQMSSRYKEQDRMIWVNMDARKMEFPNNSFDIVIDKGTVDSLLCGSNSFQSVYQMNKSVARVLKRGGKYIVITYGQPDTRIDHYRRKKLHFDVEHKTIQKPIFNSDISPTSNYYVYVITKIDDAHESDDDDDDEDDEDFYDSLQSASK
eukprot:Tbor_TRINITY_DN2683_c0_g1::TRINITY_DN2683_c0_g1_i1::g.17986::m.17986